MRPLFYSGKGFLFAFSSDVGTGRLDDTENDAVRAQDPP
jgi:hypothetical protein